jgi:hypothetical protein
LTRTAGRGLFGNGTRSSCKRSLPLLNAAVLYRFEQQNQCCDNQRRASAEKRPDEKKYFLSVIEPIEIADALRPR